MEIFIKNFAHCNIMHYRMVNRMLIMLGKAPSNPVRQAWRSTQHNGQGQDHSTTLRSGGGRFINYTEPLNSGMCRKPEEWQSNAH
jgi:hypothetical protein